MKKLTYFTGTYSIGKTTQIDFLCDYLKVRNIPYSRNKSPRIFISKDRLYNKVDDLNQFFVTFETLSDILSSKEDIYITDKWLIDNLVYASLSDGVSDRCVNIHKSFLEYFLKKWNIQIFYIPVEFSMEKDGIRLEDEKFRLTVDSKIRNLMIDLKIPYTVLSGTRSERFNKLISTLKENE